MKISISIIISLLSFCALAKTESSSLKLSGQINETLKIEAKVTYEAQRKVPGCGHYGFSIEDLGGWEKRTKDEFFAMEREAYGNYKININLKHGKVEFCHYQMRSMEISVSPTHIKSGEIPIFMTYKLLLLGSTDLRHDFNQIDDLNCKKINSANHWFVCGHEFTRPGAIGPYDSMSALYFDFLETKNQEKILHIHL